MYLKSSLYAIAKRWHLPKQTLLIMKFTAIILLSACLTASATGFSQTVTLSEKNATLEKVFASIKKQTGYVFFYDEAWLQRAEKVTIDVKNIPLENALQICFKNQALSYSIIEKTIVIKPKTETIDGPISAPPPITVTGRIVNEKGQGVIASVLVKGTQNGATSNAAGYFTLKEVDENATLIITSINIEGAVEVKVESRTNVGEIVTVTKVDIGDEVVVKTNYWETRKRLNPGNITKISGKEISKNPVSDPMAALQGRVPGMSITQSNGNPGAAFKIEIRGRTQIDRINGASNDPLYIVDNVPIASGNEYINQLGSAISQSSLSGLSPLYSINIADIESIEVLKDADATAIYGSRGANGVILITTKKGNAGKPKFNLNVSTGFSVAPLPDMLTTKEYVAMRKEALQNDGLDLTTLANSSSLSNRNKVYDLAQYDTLRDNNLTKQLIGGTARTTDVQGSVSGGSDLTQFILAGGYRRETTVVPGSFPNSRASGRFSVTTTSPNKKFKGDFTASYTSTLNTSTSTDLSFALSLPPNYKLYEDNGDLAWNEGGYKSNNPLAYILQKYKSKTTTLNTNAVLSYKILPGITLKSSIGYNFITSDEDRVRPSTAVNPLDRTGADGIYTFGHSTFKSWILEPQLEYRKSFGKGVLNTLIGGSLQSQEHKGYNIFISGFEDDSQIGTLAVVTANMFSAPSSNFSEFKYGAFFGRINYTYNDKYVLNLTGRRDGSSRFGPDYRFSNFGAIGTTWIVSDEAFMKKISFVSFAKIRASYGVTGNDKISDYKYQDVYESGFSTNSYNGLTALTPSTLYNPELHWERNAKAEVAIDLNFIEDRIQFSASWYSNRSSDPLVNYPLPAVTGYNGVVNNLNGVIVQNQGLELELFSRNIERKFFRWVTGFNITIPSNKLLKYPDFEESSYTGSYVIGQSLNTVIAGHVVGVDPATGLYLLEDYNHNGKFDPAIDGDFKPQFNTDPDFYGGLQNSISYKGISLDFLFQFNKQMGKNWIASYTSFTSPVGAVGKNYPNIVLDRWQNPGDVTAIQKFTTSASILDLAKLNGGHVPAFFSDLQYTDVSFVRLKNVSLSYNLPEKLLRRSGISSFRIYVQGQNLLTFTPYKIGDPETASLTSLPPLRTIVAGAQINF